MAISEAAAATAVPDPKKPDIALGEDDNDEDDIPDSVPEDASDNDEIPDLLARDPAVEERDATFWTQHDAPTGFLFPRPAYHVREYTAAQMDAAHKSMGAQPKDSPTCSSGAQLKAGETWEHGKKYVPVDGPPISSGWSYDICCQAPRQALTSITWIARPFPLPRFHSLEHTQQYWYEPARFAGSTVIMQPTPPAEDDYNVQHIRAKQSDPEQIIRLRAVFRAHNGPPTACTWCLKPASDQILMYRCRECLSGLPANGPDTIGSALHFARARHQRLIERHRARCYAAYGDLRHQVLALQRLLELRRSECLGVGEQLRCRRRINKKREDIKSAQEVYRRARQSVEDAGGQFDPAEYDAGLLSRFSSFFE
ncbi:hypothetical protein DFH06DRAFT_1343934 [Mycena polygramma]|nr:hypothetical protein DFH06DRAFT_1343934 [Mycena polygramma]